MTTITDLPVEVIYIILQQKIIDIEDAISFSLTCRRFNDVFDNLLWKTKLYQSFDIRWPYLKKIYDNRIQNKESINFKDEVKANVKCREALFSYLPLLTYDEWKVSHSVIKIFDILFRPNIGARIMNYHFLKDELLYQIKMSPLDPKCNLTQQYYSKKLLPFLQRRHLEDVWLEFINYPKEQQLFENAATILAQWYQPQKRIYNFDIEASLDDIAQQTLNSLKKAHWDHPIFSTSVKQLSFWKYNNIDDNQWRKTEERQIIDVLLTVLFDELGFHVHRNSNYEPQDVFIDCVLESKVGSAITLAIIFQSVARRLGVCCDLVDSVLGWLCWKPKSITENPEDEKYFYIDILRGGTINERAIDSYKIHKKISPTEMVLLMHRILSMDIFVHENSWSSLRIPLKEYVYVESNSLEIEIEYPLQIKDCFNIMNMARFLSLCQALLQWIQNNYNNRKSVEASRPIEDILRTFELSVQHRNLQISKYIKPKKRTRNMKYAVGMVVTCIKNGLNQTGVVIGWDAIFDKHSRIHLFNRTVVNKRGAQPVYIILCEDGLQLSAAQDTVIEAGPRWIELSGIGRYFCRFTDGYYVPNEALTRRYPYDQAVTTTRPGRVPIAHGAIAHVQSHRPVPRHFLVPTNRPPITSRRVLLGRGYRNPSRDHGDSVDSVNSNDDDDDDGDGDGYYTTEYQSVGKYHC